MICTRSERRFSMRLDSRIAVLPFPACDKLTVDQDNRSVLH